MNAMAYCCLSRCTAKIEQMGFKPEKVAELVSRTFNEMVFIHNIIHCDPHAVKLFLYLSSHKSCGLLFLLMLQSQDRADGL